MLVEDDEIPLALNHLLAYAALKFAKIFLNRLFEVKVGVGILVFLI